MLCGGSKIITPEWETENDRCDWYFDEFHCIALRHPTLKHFCGYLILPEDHNYYGKDYDNIPIDVHGGLTYAGKNSLLNEEWCIGFDCGHFNDYSPGIANLIGMTELMSKDPEVTMVYRNITFMRKELKSLAHQCTNEHVLTNLICGNS